MGCTESSTIDNVPDNKTTKQPKPQPIRQIQPKQQSNKTSGSHSSINTPIKNTPIQQKIFSNNINAYNNRISSASGDSAKNKPSNTTLTSDRSTRNSEYYLYPYMNVIIQGALDSGNKDCGHQKHQDHHGHHDHDDS